jgi:hypothetical protein
MNVLVIGSTRKDVVLLEHVVREVGGLKAYSFTDARRALLWSWES